MNFEVIPNELLLYLFEFLRTDHLIYAFHDLNSRFNSLLFQHFAAYSMDLRGICSKDLATICREYLPNLMNKLPSLHLSEEDGSSRALNRLKAYGFTLDQFIQLKSLSLSNLSRQQVIGKIKFALPHLINLTHLTLKRSFPECVCEDRSTAFSFINCIWSLPKLTHCHIDGPCTFQIGTGVFIEPTIISSSISHLSIVHIDKFSFNLSYWSHNTPNLQHLSISFSRNGSDKSLSLPILSITSFELPLGAGERDLLSILRWMPNLNRLKLICIYFINGHEWANIISNHLPKLKRFHFRMAIVFARNEMIEQQVDKVLNTFRTPFWLDEHGWFVRCDWVPTEGNVCIYTLPYSFGSFDVSTAKFSKSTCPQEKNQYSYDYVHTLRYYGEPVACSHKSDIQFYKLQKLVIKLPVSNYFWSLVPAFDHLTSCEIISQNNSKECKNQLELLLSRASHLSSLGLSSYDEVDSIENLSLQTKNTSLKRLDLQRSYGSYNEEHCVRFSHSCLVMQCEEVHIYVQSRTSICYLVKTMHNLRLLYVKCDDDKQRRQCLREDDEDEQSSIEDEFVSWLRHQLLGVRSLVEIYRWFSIIVLRLS